MQMNKRDIHRKQEIEEVKTFNTKAHFGPEETEEVAIHIRQKQSE